jgi:CO/xanthine dehydrogenase Mo-binding subunit
MIFSGRGEKNMKNYKVLGQRVKRIDAQDKVRGKALFGDDKSEPNMLYGKILYSPYAHARIVSLSTREAEKLPGVRAVVTAADAPVKPHGWLISDEWVFARDKVRYKGDRVAAVAVEREEIAQEALSLIKVEYEPLPAVFDPEEAMKPEAVIIHEDLAQYKGALAGKGRGNINFYCRSKVGDVEKAFQEADYIFEGTYTTPNVHQGYLEPHSALAKIDASGKVTVWVSTQGSFMHRFLLCQALGKPKDQVEVIPSVIGGGFGGKFPPLISHVAVLLAEKAKQPVKVTMTREEEFKYSTPRSSSKIFLKTGVKKDGTIIAREARLIYDSGAYAGMSPLTAQGSTAAACGPYRIPNARLEGYCVYTNTVSCGSYRAPGFPQVTFAIESQMDEIAEKLGIDPLELRQKNILQDGDLTFAGEKLERSSLGVALNSVAEQLQWSKPSVGKNRGKGLACAQWNTTSIGSGVRVMITGDNNIEVITGSVDLTGSSTVLAQVAAEEFALPFEKVRIRTESTSNAIEAPASGGSWLVYNMSNATKIACQQAKNKLLEFAAQELDFSQEDLGLADGQVFSQKNKAQKKTLGELAARYKEVHNEWIIGEARDEVLNHTITFVAQGAEVEVDPQTGEIRILRLIGAQDAGFALNPDLVEGQIQGGMGQGVGFALFEQMKMHQGEVINPNFADYKMPTALDLPFIETKIIEYPSSQHPYGARGVGEPPHIPMAAAIANAIYQAIGVRFYSLPITPEKILWALKSKA